LNAAVSTEVVTNTQSAGRILFYLTKKTKLRKKGKLGVFVEVVSLLAPRHSVLYRNRSINYYWTHWFEGS
jgi:hypothetical protein